MNAHPTTFQRLRLGSLSPLSSLAPLALAVLLLGAPAAQAQVTLGIALPGIDIGINVPVFPRLVLVPGQPVYYDPNGQANYFFYDGLYWVFRDDSWYESSWYNGPWRSVDRNTVPLYVLRVPVRYYRRPPAYFRGWSGNAAPRWGEHWGGDWEQQHPSWNQWNRRQAPPPAPLPIYQRQYPTQRYPQAMEQQNRIRDEHYRFRPREPVTQQRWQRDDHGAAKPQAPGRVERQDGRDDKDRRDRKDEQSGGRR